DLVGILGGLVLVVMLIGHLWVARDEVLRGLFEGGSRLAHAVAQAWMPLVTGYLLLAWAFWAGNILQGDRTGATAAVKSGLILLAVPLVDRLAALVFPRVLLGRATPLLAMARRVAQAAIRLVLLSAVVVLLVESWGGELLLPFSSPVGAVIVRATLSAALALL